MKRTHFFLFLMFIANSILSCKKGVGIPEEYSFLKGTWYCGYCVYDSMQIENHRIVFTSNKLRPNVIYFDKLNIFQPNENVNWLIEIEYRNKILKEIFDIKTDPTNNIIDTLYYGLGNNSNIDLGDPYVKQ